jgi:hypothetical protein
VPRRDVDLIELRAADPDGDLACDFTIANDMARTGLREELSRGIMPPVRQLENGVEVSFTPDSWDAVLRYIELESRCCSFLDLSMHKTSDAVVLRVTGRPEARELIANIFTTA